jgi:VWFA-related protein
LTVEALGFLVLPRDFERAYTWTAHHMGLTFVMRRALFFCLFAQFAIAAFASGRVTVDQLTKVVAASKSERDSKIAARLAAMELTERLNAARLSALEETLPGPESRRALVALADQAEFLAPPPAEIPNQPAPSLEQQREITARAIEYLKTTLHRLPNLIARRDTIRFEDSPAALLSGGLSAPSGIFVTPQPLHPVSRYTKTVTYRDGEEIDQSAGDARAAQSSGTTGLNSVGEFGPVLSAVFGDLPAGKLAWSRWEQGAAGNDAVFGFTVPKEASHFEIRFCCVGGDQFRQFSAYHGEITIAPDDGTILRLVLITDLRKYDPIKKANLMVEYGPVELGKQKFYCPAKSISVIVAPIQTNIRKALPGGPTVPTTRGQVQLEAQDSSVIDAPLQTLLNEVVFEQYHLFYTEAHVLTADNSTPATTEVANAAELTVAVPATSPAAFASTANEISVPVASTPGGAAKTDAEISATASTAPSSGSSVPSAPAISEMTVTVQRSPSLPDVAPDSPNFSLRVTSRIVEVSVSAFDKKGLPVTDLSRGDFEIDDGGRKQILRSFGRATSARTAMPVSSLTAQPVEFTNRAEATSNSTPSAGKVSTESSTIIFFDASSLQFGDLTRARDQVLRIIGTLPASEPVGLYVRIGFGFKVLLEATTDRAAIAEALHGWSPDARDLARAQEAEQRNRQQFDSLRNPRSVDFTYASVGSPGGGPMVDMDPKLYNLGEDPPREALSVLVAVAAHMGAIAGHKNLVWVASDNVLADWTDQSADGDAGRMSPNSIGAYSIRTQEALNNAHVSLYPFDASQLETDATDASLQNAGVELDPSVKDNFPGYKAPPGGRSLTQLRTQTHPVQAAIQQLAQSTGGQSYGRSSNVIANLGRVIEDSKAIYLLSFAPDTQPDDKYHQLKVTVPGRRDIKLRYRTGYLYSKEPATLKDRFAQVLWQPFDAAEIAITARRTHATGGAVVSLNIAASDVGLVQTGDHWTGKLDIFLVHRNDSGAGAKVKEQTMAFNLSNSSYEKLVHEGIPFEQYLGAELAGESVRLIVVDENSARIGSITLPATTEHATQ